MEPDHDPREPGELVGPDFRRGAVRPVECLGAGWRLIKDQYWLFLGITFLGVLLASLAPMAILLGPGMCGIYYCLLRREAGRRVSFDMLFRGFDYFVQSLIAALVMVIPVVVLVMPAYALLFAGMMFAVPRPVPGQPPPPPPDPAIFFGSMAAFMAYVIAISLAFQVLFMFTFPLIVDRRVSGMEAVGLSIRAAAGNFFGILGLVLLLTLLSFIGVLACYVGAIFVMPVSFAAQAIAYRQVFPAEDDYVEKLPESDRPEQD